jgi:flagellar hook-associated protein 3 FlgL
MVTNLDPANAQFVAQMKNIQTRMQRAQTQVASGKRVTVVSDDPDQISDLLSARASLSAARQSNANLNRVQTEVNAAEKGLAQASMALERARVVGAQGANGTQTPDTRATLASEVESVLDQLVGISRTTVEGRYIFSGDSDMTSPYSIDLNLMDPVSLYAGAATTTRQIQHPNGSRFTVSKSAQEIFDNPDPALNVFRTVTALRNALRAGDETAIQSALDDMASAAPHLERMLAYYGTAQNRVAEAVDYGKKLELDLTAQIANIENVDTTSAILEMQQAAVQQQAALQSKAQMQRKSLFDYLG